MPQLTTRGTRQQPPGQQAALPAWLMQTSEDGDGTKIKEESPGVHRTCCWREEGRGGKG